MASFQKTRLLSFLTCVLGVALLRPLAIAEEGTAASTGAAGPKRTYAATRVAAAPKIDGKLDDACWTNGEWSLEFIQYEPRHGSKASEPTRMKVLYDDKYLYIGIRADDSQPDGMIITAGPRDSRPGDAVGIAFDTYFDHRTGFEFDLTSAGQKLDFSVADDRWDSTWNAVWDGKVSHDTAGWSAEMRIPLNQLRYVDRNPQVWGMHAFRKIARYNEESQWQLLGNDNSGMVYNFGELQGLVLPKPRRHIELIPYASGKYTTGSGAAPRTRKEEFEGGLDAKLQLSSSFTLDATVNPDFGQVEADPSEMNLTAFETRLEERRPFFLEGKNILSFEFDDADVFYSRRIGRSPSLGAPGGAYDIPDNTTILGAWKVTGKTDNGLSLGILHAVTDEEHTHYLDETGRQTVVLEPAANYLMVRGKQDLNGGNTTVGGIATFTERSIKTDALRARLPRQAVVGGLDLLHYWNDRTYYVTARVLGSRVTGDRSAISRLQTSSARYYQRPDADHLEFDPNRTSLDGWAASVDVGKSSKGHWRFNNKVIALSPGLELNDLGYVSQTDRLRQRANLSYQEKEPSLFYRDFQIELGHDGDWDTQGGHLNSRLELNAWSGLRNNDSAGVNFSYWPESLDPTALRGGPALKTPSAFEYSANYDTNQERKVSAWFNFSHKVGSSSSLDEKRFEAGVRFRPISALTLSLEAEKERTHEDRHYVSARSADGTPVYLVSPLKSDSLTYTFRVQCFFRPELSLQYYGSPFGSSGAYSGFSRVTDPRAGSYAARVRNISPTGHADGVYSFDENQDGLPDYTAHRSDFSFGEFRSNLVLRWEFRPGSNLYAVWSQGRNDGRDYRTGTSKIINRLPNAPVVDVFMIKCSYWFSL